VDARSAHDCAAGKEVVRRLPSPTGQSRSLLPPGRGPTARLCSELLVAYCPILELSRDTPVIATRHGGGDHWIETECAKLCKNTLMVAKVFRSHASGS
jgi:hypothetical protein